MRQSDEVFVMRQRQQRWRRYISRSMAAIGATLGAWLLTAWVPVGAPAQASGQTAEPRPNILWITSEDNGPQYGAYGDGYSITPNIDKLAARGFRYRVAWSNGPVCGASRTALILGVHPQSTGGEHMRSLVRLPASMRLYPALLRQAGYYVTNNNKTDYNYPESPEDWDASSNTAHWKNRTPGQPFFAVFNIGTTHEAQIRSRPHAWEHDVEKAPVPPYQPNVKETREDWAQYYDKLSEMDATLGQRLAELQAAGLADDTIVMHFGDHGAGIARSKRFPYNSGLQVGVVVYVPPRFRHLAPPEASQPGSESSRLISFVDFAPTMLSLAGVKPPDWMQGRAFLGQHTVPAPEYLFGFRGRMDERYDLTRSVRDDRYVYLRNYMPHRPYGQHVEYMFQTPTTQVWKRMFDEGKLDAVQAAFWQPKPTEELYDLQDDRWETRNLAASSAHADVLRRLRQALDRHTREVRDVGFLPEYELHRGSDTPYERARDARRYDFDRIYAVAQQATDRDVPHAALQAALGDSNPIVRYWAALGMVVRGKEAVAAVQPALEKLLDDPEPGPRIVAAEALGRFGPASLRPRVMTVLLRDANAPVAGGYVAHLALYTLNQFTDLTADEKAQIAQLSTAAPAGEEARGGDYRAIVKRAIAQDVR
jgi:uncharacterized sulfatase